jgi:hypothetical protein
MLSTVVINVDRDLAEFVHHQEPAVDPSTFITRLIREDMKRNPAQIDSQTQQKVQNNQDTQTLEDQIDQDIPSAG